MIPRLTFLLIAAFWVAMKCFCGARNTVRTAVGVPVPRGAGLAENFDRAGRFLLECLIRTVNERVSANSPPASNRKWPSWTRTTAAGGLVARAGLPNPAERQHGLRRFHQPSDFRRPSRVFTQARMARIEPEIVLAHRRGRNSSLATNQTVHLKIITDGVSVENVFTFADLQNPNALMARVRREFRRRILGRWTGSARPAGRIGALAQDIRWEARRDRLRIGGEPVSVYRLETRVLDHPIVIYVSTLGEILRVELPGGVTAALDELANLEARRDRTRQSRQKIRRPRRRSTT